MRDSLGSAHRSRASVVRLRNLPPEELIFGLTETMQALRRKIEKAAPMRLPVLILGESGTGKEVVAKFVHCCSPWYDGPFVQVNCPALPGALVESELFGFEQGAFTGAYATKPGLVELADGGTLFLDEIAELEPSLQAKLLQLLQDGTFSRLGSQESRHVEVRIVCATSRSLERDVEAGSFRQDLYFRINVVTLGLVPLRERRLDVPQLVRFFLEFYQKEFNSEAQQISPGVMQLLIHHDWPGNIRELENVIKCYVILGSEEAITSALLKNLPGNADGSALTEDSVSLKTLTRQAVQELERKIILDVLHANNWNRKEAARLLKISYRTLFYKLKQAGIPQKRRLSLPRSDSGAQRSNNTRRDQDHER